MKDYPDNFQKAIEALRNSQIPKEPPQEIIDDTVTRLSDESQGVTLRRYSALATFGRLAAAAVIIIAVFAAVYIFTKSTEKPQPFTKAPVAPAKEAPAPETVKHTTKEKEADTKKEVPIFEKKLPEALEHVEELYRAGDIEGLLYAMEDQRRQVKMDAAYYLATLGDEQVVDILEELNDKWQGNPYENPYTPAFLFLKARLEKELAKPNEPNEKPKAEKIALEETDGMFALLIINKTDNSPMAGVKLEINIDEQKSSVVTDANGLYRIKLPENLPDNFRITAKKDGFVPMQITFRSDLVNMGIPLNYVLKLESGTSIGGTVVNEEDIPIENATVFLLVPGNENQIERVAIQDHKETTDANGHWQCNYMPSELEKVLIRYEHKNYIGDDRYSSQTTINRLRDMTALKIMKKGLVLKGYVFDSNGTVVKNASVAQGSDLWGSHYPKTKTNEFGFFEFKNVNPGQTVLTVHSKKHAPDLREITVDETIESLEFTLEPGYTLKGYVFDANGNPVEGARISADTWRTHRSIFANTKTDANGFFQWKHAPKDPVLYAVLKKGYMSVRQFPMTASDQLYTIILYPPLRVSGNVVDAETNELIETFKAIPGIRWESGQISWDRQRSFEFSDGQYEFDFDYPRPAHLIRIEAKNYLPAVSRDFNHRQGQVVYNFRLEKGENISGVVYLPTSQPVSNTKIAIATTSKGIHIENGEFARLKEHQLFKTDAYGQFSIPPQTESYKLAVVHDDGYAEVNDFEFEQDRNIVLIPWSRIEGTLFIGKNVGKNERIHLSYDTPHIKDAPRVWYHYEAHTDTNGQFILKNVHQGQARVSRIIKTSNASIVYANSEQVEVPPGKTVYVTIGGKGRPITGKITSPLEYQKPVDWTSTSGTLITKRPEYPKPSNYEQMTPEEKSEYYQNWKQTTEGKEFEEDIRNNLRSYAFKINPDGTFRIDDVAEGIYVLRIQLSERPEIQEHGDLTGTIGQDVNVPSMQEDYIDEPLDIGTLELEIKDRGLETYD
ncbi:MAG: carboxypeptidase-like regulatory domain-containing protein [Planctomycetota bacterium]|jgi:protocatechuate 3,4-dioxygenase beta subunit